MTEPMSNTKFRAAWFTSKRWTDPHLVVHHEARTACGRRVNPTKLAPPDVTWRCPTCRRHQHEYQVDTP